MRAWDVPWRGRRVRGPGKRRGGGRARVTRLRRGCRARRGRVESVHMARNPQVSPLIPETELRKTKVWSSWPTHLVHLCQRPLLHLLQRDHLIRLLVPREIHLSIPALPNLRHDMEHIHLEFGPPLAKEDALAACVACPFGGDLGGCEGGAGGDGGLEGGETGFARGDVGEEVEVVVVEDCESRRAGGSVRSVIASDRTGTMQNAHSWATSAFRLTSGELSLSFSHSLKP